MRRLVPWLLLSILVVGAVAAAALGITGKSASTRSQWVAGVLAATEAAGSADFSYSNVTLSPNPELRGSLSGHGVVDFSTGDSWVTEVDRDISFSASGNQPLHPVPSTNRENSISANGIVYQSSPIPGFAFADQYNVLPFPRLPRSQRSFSLGLNASVGLDMLHGSYAVASVTDIGPAEVDGRATTQYKIEYVPLHLCVPHQKPQFVTQRPSRVWLDDAGRLVRIQGTLYFSDRLPRGVKVPPALDGFPRGSTTTVATLTFSEFGVPVHVSAPPASAVRSAGRTSIGAVKIDSCR